MSFMHIPHLSLSQPKRTEITQTMKRKSKVTQLKQKMFWDSKLTCVITLCSWHSQFRIAGDLRFHFLVCWCCYLQQKITKNWCKILWVLNGGGGNWGIELDNSRNGRGHMIHRHDELMHKPARYGHERSTQPEYPSRARRQAESEEVLV